ncbi:MAG: ClpX C4-type zinc finger protein [Kofleriaceae bacterium]
MSSTCPVCAGALGGGELILVCSGCRHQLGVGAVRATGEFRVPTELDEPAPPGATSSPTGSAGACSWCGRPAAQVKKLLGTAAVAICNECVALCADVLAAELGPDWR